MKFYVTVLETVVYEVEADSADAARLSYGERTADVLHEEVLSVEPVTA